MTVLDSLPEAAFNAWDKNGYEIDFSTFEFIFQSLTSNQYNRDGKVDKTEWIEKMSGFVDEISAEELDNLWSEYDADKSDYLGKSFFK